MVEHKVLVRGAAVRGSGSDPSAAGAVLLRLDHSLRGAVDVAFRGSSSSGRRQQWLRLAGQARFRHAEKSGAEELAIYLEAPRFGDVATEYFSQQRLFDDGPDANETAFDALAGAVGDVMQNKADSDRFDVGLLRRFHKYEASVFQKKVDEVEINGSEIGSKFPCRISRGLATLAKQLYLKTPAPTRVRIAGRLDMIEASTLAFALVLPTGEKVRGIWRGRDFETLHALVNTDAVATGMAVYRPSGTLLRIDADALTAQQAGDRLFARLPAPTGGKLNMRALVREQQKLGGMAAIGGQLPAEESDEEFLAAVAEMD